MLEIASQSYIQYFTPIMSVWITPVFLISVDIPNESTQTGAFVLAASWDHNNGISVLPGLLNQFVNYVFKFCSFPGISPLVWFSELWHSLCNSLGLDHLWLTTCFAVVQPPDMSPMKGMLGDIDLVRNATSSFRSLSLSSSSDSFSDDSTAPIPPKADANFEIMSVDRKSPANDILSSS